MPAHQTPLQLVTGEVSAPDWESLYRDHVGPLYRYVYRRCGNRPDAEDVTSTVFLRALPRLRMGASEGELRAYLHATARTVLVDLWRDRHGVDVNAELVEALPASHPPEHADIDVDRVLTGLPEHYRQVLELRFLRGYSLRETAATMATSVANVKVMQLRALRRAASRNAS